ncbi:hypothetical protein ZIOFF_025027 [Zingiber officinale]|uniref:RING-type domain-containing protein n=1 Tax=Zingiber officinale TaxID=94328 RepID=A0A8J5GUF5_ZINOF|nr:hypothetical protein ZIOFF_025027 [Zingiber officinale]
MWEMAPHSSDHLQEEALYLFVLHGMAHRRLAEEAAPVACGGGGGGGLQRRRHAVPVACEGGGVCGLRRRRRGCLRRRRLAEEEVTPTTCGGGSVAAGRIFAFYVCNQGSDETDKRQWGSFLLRSAARSSGVKQPGQVAQIKPQSIKRGGDLFSPTPPAVAVVVSMVGGSSRWRRAAKRIGFPCGASFSNVNTPGTISSSAVSTKTEDEEGKHWETGSLGAHDKRLCAICLEPLSCVDGNTDFVSGQKIFTAQCTHAFHFPCIASNVRHGSVACPICRAQWSQLPRELTVPPAINNSDPILRILDDSIATSRFNRRSFLRTTQYDDDDPVELEATAEANNHRLRLTIIPGLLQTAELLRQTTTPSRQKRTYLSVKLSYQQAADLVLVASPNGPHLRLLKQSMALVVFSLQPIDRLAIVTYSTTATRALPLRRMSSQGKQAALQVIDRIFYLGEAEPAEGLRKGLKVLEDRTHRNPLAYILHLSDSPTQSYICRDLQFPIPIHRFHIGFGFGMSNGLVMQELDEFLAWLLGGMIRDTQLRIGAEGEWILLGDLRGREEKRIPVDMAANCELLSVSYSYVEGEEQRLSRGEVMVGREKKNDQNDDQFAGSDLSINTGGTDSIQRWGYLDPFMARRWAKHLHGGYKE